MVCVPRPLFRKTWLIHHVFLEHAPGHGTPAACARLRASPSSHGCAPVVGVPQVQPGHKVCWGGGPPAVPFGSVGSPPYLRPMSAFRRNTAGTPYSCRKCSWARVRTLRPGRQPRMSKLSNRPGLGVVPGGWSFVGRVGCLPPGLARELGSCEVWSWIRAKSGWRTATTHLRTQFSIHLGNSSPFVPTVRHPDSARPHDPTP